MLDTLGRESVRWLEGDNGRVKISVQTTLNCSIDHAWEALHTPAVFTRVSWPFTIFRTRHAQLPERFDTQRDYLVQVWAGGIIPLGSQTIRLIDDTAGWEKRRVSDIGRGESGVLRALRNWRHEMQLEARADGQCDFRDTLTAEAGWLTPLAWLGLRVFWGWRAMRLRRVARELSPASTAQWNARYLAKPSMWSGNVNPVLETEASRLTPGVAIDAGAGEGADALWLAEHGWSVTALEASSVAVYRGVMEAEKRTLADPSGRDIHWRVFDVQTPWPTPPQSADLVSLQFIHTDEQSRRKIWQEAVHATKPGGTLLIVGHDPADSAVGIPRPPAEMCFDADWAREFLEPQCQEVSVRRVSRTQTREGVDYEVTDIVVVATR